MKGRTTVIAVVTDFHRTFRSSVIMPSFIIGDRVRLRDLTATHFNGLEGVVIRPQQTGGRLDVQVVSEDKDKLMRIKADNLDRIPGNNGKLRVHNLTEQRDTYQLEILCPQHWTNVRVFVDEDSSDNATAPAILLRSQACGKPQSPLEVALPAAVSIGNFTQRWSADECKLIVTLRKMLAGVVDLDKLPPYELNACMFFSLMTGTKEDRERPFIRVCGRVNEMMTYQSRNETVRHMISTRDENMGVIVLPTKLLGDVNEPILEVRYWASLTPEDHDEAQYVLMNLARSTHPDFSDGPRPLNACELHEDIEAVLLLIEMLEINSVRISGYRNRQCVDELGFIRSFLPRVLARHEADWEYSLQPYREREGVGAGLTTGRLQLVHEYRRRHGLVPQARGVDWSGVCACCGSNVSDRIRWWCLACRRLSCCSSRCLQTLKDVHEPWCSRRPLGAMGHGASLPTPLAISLVTAAERLAVPRHNIKKTQRSLQSLFERIATTLRTRDPRFRRIAVGGSFAKRTAMRLSHDVDVVLLFDFSAAAAQSGNAFCDEHATALETVEGVLVELGVEVTGRGWCYMCIEARWEGQAVDVLVGFDCVTEKSQCVVDSGQKETLDIGDESGKSSEKDVRTSHQDRFVKAFPGAAPKRKNKKCDKSPPSHADVRAKRQYQAAFDHMQRFGRTGNPAAATASSNASPPVRSSAPARVSSPQKRMSPSFTESSVMFMANQPLAVLRAIRVTKLWKRCLIVEDALELVPSVEKLVRNPAPDTRSHLSSYALELLVVHMYRKLKAASQGSVSVLFRGDASPDPENTDVLFRELLFFISRLDPDMRQEKEQRPAAPVLVEFSDFYDPKAFLLPGSGASNPLVLRDPVNPTSDVVRFFRRWSALIQAARRALCTLALAEDPVRELFLGDTFPWLHEDDQSLLFGYGSDRYNKRGLLESDSEDELEEHVFSEEQLKSDSDNEEQGPAGASSEFFPDLGQVGRPSDRERKLVGLQRDKLKLQKEIEMMLPHSCYEDSINSHRKKIDEVDMLISIMGGGPMPASIFREDKRKRPW